MKLGTEFEKYKQVLDSEIESGKYGECVTLTVVERVKRKARQYSKKYACTCKPICILPEEGRQHATVICSRNAMVYSSPYIFGVQIEMQEVPPIIRIAIDDFSDDYQLDDFQAIGQVYEFQFVKN